MELIYVPKYQNKNKWRQTGYVYLGRVMQIIKATTNKILLRLFLQVLGPMTSCQ